MYIDDLTNRIKEFDNDPFRVPNHIKNLSSAPADFAEVIKSWVYGGEKEYEFNGITLSFIQQKEHCDYFRALVRMRMLMRRPDLAEGYIDMIMSDK